MNLQESTTILNLYKKSLETYLMHHVNMNAIQPLGIKLSYTGWYAIKIYVIVVLSMCKLKDYTHTKLNCLKLLSKGLHSTLNDPKKGWYVK